MPLDITLFRGSDADRIRLSEHKRGADPTKIDVVIALDAEWRACEFAVNQLKKQANAISKVIGPKVKAKEDVSQLKAEVFALQQQVATKTAHQQTVRKKLDESLRLIGNLVDESVPVASNESFNTVVRIWGQERQIRKEVAKFHHHELLHMIDGYSPERGAKIAGHRGYFLRGMGVLLNQALVQYGLAFLMKRQFTPLQPPFFMRKQVMAETAQLQDFDESLYHVQGSQSSTSNDDDLYLIATSEQPISAYHRDEVLDRAQLPLRYGGVSTCFRKEAGSHGKDVWGIFRVHQFEKLEQFCITTPESSAAMLEEMMNTCEVFYQSLGLSYQVVSIVSGALNSAASKKYDLEAFFPTVGEFRELVSASNCTDYQSRAMNIRLGHPKRATEAGGVCGEREYVHMLNATLCATERTMCCLLENYQTPAGIIVPEVLRPFLGGVDLIPFVNAPPPRTTAAAAAAAK